MRPNGTDERLAVLLSIWGVLDSIPSEVFCGFLHSLLENSRTSRLASECRQKTSETLPCWLERIAGRVRVDYGLSTYGLRPHEAYGTSPYGPFIVSIRNLLLWPYSNLGRRPHALQHGTKTHGQCCFNKFDLVAHWVHYFVGLWVTVTSATTGGYDLSMFH